MINSINVYELRQAIRQLPDPKEYYLNDTHEIRIRVNTQLQDIRLAQVSQGRIGKSSLTFKDYTFKVVNTVATKHEDYYDWILVDVN